MIDSIELKNWKTHEETKLRFSKGTNILLGPMGSGKSSIMDAISFALFGTYPAIQHRRVAVDEIIMNRPEQKNRGSVKLEFALDGVAYTIERTLELNGSSKATLAKEGAYLQSQPQRVNEEVEKILKVDYDLFSRAIYSEQNRLTYFLELPPRDRKKQIDELLGLDKFATAQENATTLINKIKDMASESEKTIAGFDVNRLKEQHKAILEQIDQAHKERKSLEEELKGNEKEKSSAEKKLKETKEAFSRKTLLAKQIAELKSRMAIIEKEIEKIEKKGVGEKGTLVKKLKEASANFEAFSKKEKAAEEEEKSSFQQLAHTEAELRSASKELDEREKLRKELAKRNRAELEEMVKKNAEEAKKRGAERDSAVAQRNENKRWLDELKKHWDKCPVCERELDEKLKNKILEEREKEVGRLEGEIEKQKAIVERLEKEVETGKKEVEGLNRIEERLKEQGDVDKKVRDLKEKEEKEKEENSKLKKKKDDAKSAAVKAKDDVAKLEAEKETAERREGYIEEKAKDSKEIKEREEEHGKIEVSEQTIDKLQDELTSLSVKSKELSTRLDANAESEKERAAQLEEKRKEIDAVDKMQDEVKRKRKVVESITDFKNALEQTQTTLRTKLIGSINDIMHEIWPELYPYGDYHSLILEPTAEDYMLKVKTARGSGSEWENVDTIASGGEKSVACLAMRVAFAKVLVPNLRWIILDEPTHNIDQQGLSKFVKAINEVLPKIVDQVFIITHDEMLKQVVNARIYVLSRNKEESGGTSVEAY